MERVMNIKGKDYMLVHGRLDIFRTDKKYNGYSLTTELVHLNDDSCVMKATIADANGNAVATGYAQEDRGSSYINKTSFIENCETSAWGRALANLGIGIDTSVASADEVSLAIAKQNAPNSSATNDVGAQDLLEQSLSYIKEGKTKPERNTRFTQVIKKYGTTLTDEQRASLQSAVSKS